MKTKHPAWKDEWNGLKWTIALRDGDEWRGVYGPSLSSTFFRLMRYSGVTHFRWEQIMIFRYGIRVSDFERLCRLVAFVERRWMAARPKAERRFADKLAQYNACLEISDIVFGDMFPGVTRAPTPLTNDPFGFLLADFRKKKLSKARNRLTRLDDKA